MKLTIVRGLPGSAKSTFARCYRKCLILENDQFQMIDGKYCWSAEGTKRAISMVRRIAEMALMNGSDVCIANTFTKRRFVEGFKQLAEKYNATFEVVRCIGEFDNEHNVPESIFNNMKAGFEDWPGETIYDPMKDYNHGCD